MQQGSVSAAYSGMTTSSHATTYLGSPVSVGSRTQSQAGSVLCDDVDSYNPVQHEQAMWRAVIVQSLMDAASTSKKPELMVWRREAEVWLRGNTSDFYTVCYHAGLEPDFVREMAATALKNGCVWRASPGSGPMKYDPRRKNTKNPRHFTQRR